VYGQVDGIAEHLASVPERSVLALLFPGEAVGPELVRAVTDADSRGGRVIYVRSIETAGALRLPRDGTAPTPA